MQASCSDRLYKPLIQYLAPGVEISSVLFQLNNVF
jgi:hypothetical protein